MATEPAGHHAVWVRGNSVWDLRSHPKCVQLGHRPNSLAGWSCHSPSPPVRKPVQSAIAGREEVWAGRASTLPKVSSLWSPGHTERGQQASCPVSFSLKELVWPTALSQNSLLNRSPGRGRHRNLGRGAMPSTLKPWPNAVCLYSTD